METRKCNKCHVDKPINAFPSKGTNQSRCKACEKEYKREWYLKNKKEIKSRSKDYYNSNKEVAKARRREYYEKNKESVKAYNKKYRKRSDVKKRLAETEKERAKDPSYKLSRRLRTRLNSAIKGQYKVGSAVRDLGCSVDEFKEYISSKFQEGMTWDNWGTGKGNWHLDHILPLSSFDLTDKDQFLKAVHYTNYQPMWSTQNLEKHASVPEDHSTSQASDQLTRTQLTHLYVYCKMSYQEIADKYGVSKSYIGKLIKKFNIKEPLDKILSKEVLESMVKSRKKVPQIAKELGTTESSVSRYMKKHGISSKWHTHYDTKKLERWAAAGLSARQIGDRLGLNRTSTKSLLRIKKIKTTLKSVKDIVDPDTVL